MFGFIQIQNFGDAQLELNFDCCTSTFMNALRIIIIYYVTQKG